MTFTLFAVAAPATISWSPTVAIIMIVCNVVAIAIGKFKIDQPSAGPALPMPQMFGGMGLPAVLATTAFGHILGAGVILGFANMGVI